MTIFCDKCIPHDLAKVVSILRAKRRKNRTDEIVIEVHRDHFSDPSISDAEWIEAVAAWNPKPAILTYDGNILKRRIEYEAIRQYDLTIMDLRGWSSLPFNHQVSNISKHWEQIINTLEKTKTPTIYYVSRDGVVTALGPSSNYRV